MSVVVLPFTNATGDPNQEYVADAITEEITVQLSKIKGSFVIGRNTAFAFKGKTTDLKAIAKELNVRYVLQGTAARSENGFHVTTELVDGTTGSNLWADTFDAGLDRVGDIRREVVARLTVALRLQLISAEARKAEGSSNPNATDLTMRAWAKYNHGFTKENNLAALDLFEKALQVQPEFEPALVGRGGMRISLASAYPGPNKDQQLLDAERDGLRAISLDASDPRAYYLIGQVRTFQARTEEAILAIDEAIDLNPNFPNALAQRGLLMFLNGQAALAFEPLQKALELSPLDPSRGIWLSWVCHAYIHLGKHSDAISWCEKSASLAPFWLNLSDLVAAYTALGDVEKAEAAKAKLLKIQPDFSITWIKNLNLSNNPVWRKQAEENFWSYERKAGIPD
jgi:TolB-like protein